MNKNVLYYKLKLFKNINNFKYEKINLYY
jgi:hypothetical protein